MQRVQHHLWQGVWSLILVLVLGLWTMVAAVDFQYEYDALNRLITVIDSDGNVVFYTYDEVGNLIALIHTTTDAPPVLIDATVNRGDSVELIIRGNGLLPGTPTITHAGVTLGGFSATATEVRIRLDVASNAVLGATTLTLATASGEVDIALTVVGPRPLIASISPNRGPSSGGTSVTIVGMNFTADTTVAFGGNPGGDVAVVNATTITALTPAGLVGLAVDVTVSNSRGSSSLPGGFTYNFPFRIPGALTVETGRTGRLRATLTEPAVTDVSLILTSTDPTVASVPAMAVIAAGEDHVDIPVTAGSEGLSTVSVAVDAASLRTPVFVIAPFTGEVELVSPQVGLFAPPLVPLRTLILSRNTTQTVTVSLARPAPAGGLCVSLTVSPAAVATVPAEVCLEARQRTVTFAVMALASGEALITLTAAAEVMQLRLLVDRMPGVPIDGLATPVGIVVSPDITGSVTLTRPVGVFVSPDTSAGITLAPIVGVEVEP